jgi:hypothetical protein
MAVPIANDWKAIHDRMQQIEAERSVSSGPCRECHGRGWILDFSDRRCHGAVVCNRCRNPKNLPRPSPERGWESGFGVKGH